MLGEQYGRVLENQEITIRYEAGAFFAHYDDARYPIGPRTILPLLEPMVADLRRNHPDDHPDVLEIESIVTATKHLPKRWDTEPGPGARAPAREGDRQATPRRAGRRAAPPSATRSSGASPRSTARRGSPRSFDRLEALLGDQAYRLCFWGVAAEEINYRRFFDINDLAAIRVEEPNVLEAVHDKAVPAAARRARSPACASITSTVCSIRARYLENLQRAARRPDATGPTPRRRRRRPTSSSRRS